MKKMKAVIFDIDGTLANTDHRQHLAKKKSWVPFFKAMKDDGLHEHVANVMKMYQQNDYAICLLTGRPDDYIGDTIHWLKVHQLYHLLSRFLMRPHGDYRPDAIIKEEMYRNQIEPTFDVEVVYDDRQAVVDMWRKIGLPCFQVAPGDF